MSWLQMNTIDPSGNIESFYPKVESGNTMEVTPQLEDPEESCEHKEEGDCSSGDCEEVSQYGEEGNSSSGNREEDSQYDEEEDSSSEDSDDMETEQLPNNLAAEDAVQQLERDIRAASRPLTVEPASAVRHHKILVVGPLFIIDLLYCFHKYTFRSKIVLFPGKAQ